MKEQRHDNIMSKRIFHGDLGYLYYDIIIINLYYRKTFSSMYIFLLRRFLNYLF